ncbi:hypothetical protein MTP99_004625 [Tenebrio molitor]|nr:hypothetical protein MTP99_004625 [Tenebrio molitor]
MNSVEDCVLLKQLKSKVPERHLNSVLQLRAPKYILKWRAGDCEVKILRKIQQLIEPGVAKKNRSRAEIKGDSVGDRRAGGRCRKSRAANHRDRGVVRARLPLPYREGEPESPPSNYREATPFSGKGLFFRVSRTRNVVL